MRINRKLKRLKQSKVLVGQFQHVFISDMPDGHLVCGGCGSPEAYSRQGAHKRSECGNCWFYTVLAEGERCVYAICSNCESQLTLHFSPETDLTGMGDGELHCNNHPKSQWAMIKNSEWLSIGCRNCKEEVLIKLWTRHLETEEEAKEKGLIIQ